MPAYDYEIPETDQRITLIRPVHRRDEPLRLVRIAVPDRITIAGAAVNPFTFENQLERGWRKMEDRGTLPRDFNPREVKELLAADRQRPAASDDADSS